MIGVGIGLPFYRSFGSGIDAQAQVHYNRVIADGGVVPSGLSGVNAFFSAVKAIYGTSDINTAISAAYDAHYLGYKLGAGSGTTLGQAAQKLYAPKGIFGGIGTGSAYWEGVGVSSNFVSTPNAAANQITGNIAIWAKINLSNYNVAATNSILTKRPFTGNMSYAFQITSGGTLFFRYSSDGSQTNVNESATSSVSLTTVATNGQDIFVGMFRNASAGTVNFYYSFNGTTWLNLGTQQTTNTLNMFNTTNAIWVGNLSDGLGIFTGRIYEAKIATTFGGTPVVDFNANQYTGANTWTSTTSEVWTVNSTGAGLADVVQTTAASQPLLLAHTGENYWFGSGVTGNLCQSNTSVYNTNDIDIEVKAFAVATTGDVNFINLSNGTSTTVDFFYSRTSNAIAFQYYTGGFRSAFSVTTITDGDVFRVTRNSTTGAVVFMKNGTTIPTSGSQVAGVLDFSNTTIKIGQGLCKVYYANFYISNVLTKSFNPASYNPSVSQTQWTSATGEVWTVSTSTAATGYKGAVITKSIAQMDGIDDTISTTNTSIQTIFNSNN